MGAALAAPRSCGEAAEHALKKRPRPPLTPEFRRCMTIPPGEAGDSRESETHTPSQGRSRIIRLSDVNKGRIVSFYIH